MSSRKTILEVIMGSSGIQEVMFLVQLTMFLI
jgi:hypothetical protein